ncbi:MAG: hypothetical protein ACKPKO_45225, partial [Candidatus Fonsibacter sp.]
MLLGGKVDGKSWKDMLADNGAHTFDFIPEAQLILTMPELTLMLAEIASTRTPSRRWLTWPLRGKRSQ